MFLLINHRTIGLNIDRVVRTVKPKLVDVGVVAFLSVFIINSVSVFHDRRGFYRAMLWLTPTWAIWCTFIRSITTTIVNNFGKSSRWRSQGLLKFFRASIYRAHRAVIYAIAGLSCSFSRGCLPKMRTRAKFRKNLNL